jgi:hypothetical protein
VVDYLAQAGQLLSSIGAHPGPLLLSGIIVDGKRLFSTFIAPFNKDDALEVFSTSQSHVITRTGDYQKYPLRYADSQAVTVEAKSKGFKMKSQRQFTNY